MDGVLQVWKLETRATLCDEVVSCKGVAWQRQLSLWTAIDAFDN